jgi:predicted Fe-Mo cluster-binding NifX family protein
LDSKSEVQITTAKSDYFEKEKSMKIALPSRQNQVDEHFGHCEYFTVFTVNDKHEILSEETVSSPTSCGCKSNIAQTLAQMGVKMMLAGNMGQGAVNVLHGCGIDVLRGCTGDVKEVVEQWLAGTLADSGIACSLHEHECHEA